MTVERAGIDRAGRRRAAAELGILLALGIFMAMIGPFGTVEAPPIRLACYWILCIVGGGLIGIVIDLWLAPRIGRWWLRPIAAAVVMTPPVTLLVLTLNHLIMRQPLGLRFYLMLLWQVLVISLLVMTVRALAWRRVDPVLETRTVIAPPLPEAEAAFRRRLSAKRRTARLLAIQAQDHYLEVHTDAGSELLAMRFADALGELAGAHGYQVHRSWWVAGDAIVSVAWRRGTGEATLTGGLVVPVSRGQANKLREAGWS